MARKVSLTVNGSPIKLDKFVEGYIYHIAGGIVASLKDTGAVKDLKLELKDNGDIQMKLNGRDIPLNYFASEIIRNTLAGVVANLKGVAGETKTLQLNIEQ